MPDESVPNEAPRETRRIEEGFTGGPVSDEPPPMPPISPASVQEPADQAPDRARPDEGRRGAE